MSRLGSARFVLPADVLVTPVADLSPEVRAKLDSQGTHAITRPLSRVASKVVDADTASLVERFREPSRIVDAVIAFSREKRVDPEEALISAHPVLDGLVQAGLLVPHDSEDATEIRQSLEAGATAGSYRIVKLVRLVSDTEIYQALDEQGSPSAVKIARRASDRRLRYRLEHEAGILETLAHTVAPELLERGEVEGRRYIAIEWISGEPVSARAAELRHRQDRVGLLALCRAVAGAYGAIHRRGVLHGDVHPANVIVGSDGPVRLIDFGLARREGRRASRGRSQRGGVIHFFEPEYARAALDGTAAPPPTQEGEQYALAAMLFFVLTGRHYLDFSLESEVIMRQIAEQPPLGFGDVGANPWPEVEEILRKALRKEAAERHASVGELAEALRGELRALRRSGDGSAGLLTVAPRVRKRAAEVLSAADYGGGLFERGYTRPPYASVNYGAAGLAYALYRLACLRESPDTLALADVWSSRAMAQADLPEAFYSPEIDLTPGTVGANSLLHTAIGVYLVDALIADAQGDYSRRERSQHAFLVLTEVPTQKIDLALGTAGILLACATLFEAMPSAAIRRAGDDVLRRLSDSLGDPSSLEQGDAQLNLGVAHGWAGILFSTLRWCAASGDAVPEAVPGLLEQVHAHGEETGTGLRWRWVDSLREGGPGQYVSGWCNGSAGFVFLWTLAAEILGDDRWLEVAERAGRYAWEGLEAPPNLCCGSVGSAYSMLNLFRCSGRRIWLARAHDHLLAAAESVETLTEHPASLFRGRLGFALLASEIESPKLARMPLFESGAPSPRSRRSL